MIASSIISLVIFNTFLVCHGLESYDSPKRIIAEHGYQVEEHKIQTEDGYILTTFRMPHGTRQNKPNSRPVLLNHALMLSSGDWVTLGPQRGLAYILADNGYDVWMMNARGTTYSKGHVKLNEYTQKRKFYDFSWHEIGMYDIPANIDYILNKTNQEQLQYIGHSQGGTSLLVLLSSRPEYNKKIRYANLLAASAYLVYTHVNMVVGPFIDVIYGLTRSFAIYDIVFVDELRNVLRIVCSTPLFFIFCNNVYILGGGFADPAQTEYALFPKIFRTLPSNAAVKQLIHYSKNQRLGKFCQFDYGEDKNKKVYGATTPPDYDVSQITIPIALHVGQNDMMVPVEDARILQRKLKNVTEFHIVSYRLWNHFDFVFATDVVKYLYRDMLTKMAMY